MTVLWRQTLHELTSLRRQPITMILSVGFPLVFFVLIAALTGNEVIDDAGGVRLVQFLAPGFASFGVVMATFSFLAYGFAEARAAGVIKRQSGTPAPSWVLLGGRIGAALLLGLIATALVLSAGVLFYDLQLFARSAAAIVVALVLAAMTFSALGLAVAVFLPSPHVTMAVTNGIAIPLAFVSDIFAFGGSGAMPAWLTRVGEFFPLKHLVNVFADGLNPYETGHGFQLDHLGVIAAWGVAGTLVAAWGLRREKDAVTVGGRSGRGKVPAADRVPRRTSAPSAVTLLAGQVRHTTLVLWRDPSAVFFAVVFPVLLAVLIPTVNGGADQVLDNGQMLGGFFAATMAVYGVAVTAFVNMPAGLAESRDAGVLKRIRATPLPAWAMLTGRVVGAVVIGVLTLVAIYVVVGFAFGVAVPVSWLAALGVFLVASVCFALMGLAVLSLIRSESAVIGVSLGTLLPLTFISEVFVIGVTFPGPLEALSQVFPLRHAANAMTTAVAGDSLVAGLAWNHLGVLALWGAAGLVVTVWRFRWIATEPRPTTVIGPRS